MPFVRPSTKGVEGAEWENLFNKFVNEVNVRHLRDKRLWKIRDTKERCDAYCDQTSEQKIVNRETVRQDFVEANTC